MRASESRHFNLDAEERLPTGYDMRVENDLGNEVIVQYWCKDTQMPYAGVMRFRGKWYVWPPEHFPRHEEEFDELFLKWVETTEEYPTMEAAMFGLMLLYRAEG